MSNVLISRKINVTISNNTGGSISSNVPVTLKNVPTLTSTRLDSLVDVVANNEIDGATLVYQASTDKYVVKQLSISDVSGDLDGGVF